MPLTREVTCIIKSDRDNPYECIESIGGIGWKMTRHQAIASIERAEWQFFVNVVGRSVWVVIAMSPYGYKYLKTQSDGEMPNNLLNLPECPY